MLEPKEVLLDKAVALTDLGRDLERRKGDEKRRRLFGSSDSSAVVQGRVLVASTVGVDTDSSSLEASRECVGSYITKQSALGLQLKKNRTLTFESL
jgi:hypothetical protein